MNNSGKASAEVLAAPLRAQTTAVTAKSLGFEFLPNSIPGCYEVQLKAYDDARGRFVKVFRDDVFRQHGLETRFVEEYVTTSTRNVLRGLHFQLPPQEHTKLVYCVHGEVMDVVVDLREGSPAFGQFAAFDLSAARANMIYIPVGLAHGFYVRSESATLVYKVSSLYSPAHDTGILWNSIPIEWPSKEPITSERDRNFTAFQSFKTPFRFSG